MGPEIADSLRGVEHGAVEPVASYQSVKDEGGEDECGYDSIQKQHRKNCVIFQCCFLRSVIEAEKGSRYKCQQ